MLNRKAMQISYQSLLLSTTVINDAKQKHLGCKKSARPIRSNIANRQARPKGLISAEAKKLLYQNIFNSLNDTQYYSIFSQV